MCYPEGTGEIKFHVWLINSYKAVVHDMEPCECAWGDSTPCTKCLRESHCIFFALAAQSPYPNVCVYAYVYACVYVYVHVYVYAYADLDVDVDVCIYTHM